MAVVSMNYLLEAGVHFGHQTKRWNPKMKEYIYSTRDDIYIIDLQKTVALLETAYQKLNEIVANGGEVLFVGTKKQASEVCKEEAQRSGMYYVTERWLGGTLTNFKTIRKRIYRLEEIEKMETEPREAADAAVNIDEVNIDETGKNLAEMDEAEEQEKAVNLDNDLDEQIRNNMLRNVTLADAEIKMFGDRTILA